MRRESFLPPPTVRATSYLREKNILYMSDNLTKYPQLEKPWVEGVVGYGIGEKLFLQNIMASALHISIGFVSYDRPYLYIMNARPRELRFDYSGLIRPKIPITFGQGIRELPARVSGKLRPMIPETFGQRFR
jgi:hypothetical protein